LRVIFSGISVVNEAASFFAKGIFSIHPFSGPLCPINFCIKNNMAVIIRFELFPALANFLKQEIIFVTPFFQCVSRFRVGLSPDDF